jgi:hypothetical protein
MKFETDEFCKKNIGFHENPTKGLNTSTSSKVDMQSQGNSLHIKTVMLLPPFSSTIHLTMDFRAGVLKNTNYMLMVCKNRLCTPKVDFIKQSVDIAKL